MPQEADMIKGWSAAIIASQRDYAELRAGRGKLGLMVPEAFVRGIRHIGYRSNVEAIAELIDNSIQAYSERIDIVFGYENGASRKPRQLAVVDDGHGMPPSMLRLAMMWGGTHRENDRSGLGRYGYGLPCATVSIGRRFTIYSKTLSGRINAVTLDIDELDAGAYLDADGDVVLSSPRFSALPPFLDQHLKIAHPSGWHSGTIVLIEKLDRLEWTTVKGLTTNLVRHFGATYHKLLGQTAIHVDGTRVRPIDPLFLTEGVELHALDQDRAQPLDPITISLTPENGSSMQGEITLRYAWLPPTFGAIDKSRDAIGLNANARFSILKEYHGIVFSRNGRIVDLVARTPWTTFINNDRYIRIEIEFSASLDELFGVTTSKQQVSVTSLIWDRLREAGLHKAIEHLRAKVRTAKTELHRAAVDEQRTNAANEDPPSVSMRSGNAAATATAGRPMPPPDCPAQETPAAKALASLLNCIETRGAGRGKAFVTEYQSLLADWTASLDPATLAAVQIAERPL